MRTRLALTATLLAFGAAASAQTLGEGGSWTNNPPTYTCQEACAKKFGGSAGEYWCSTKDNTIEQRGFACCWGNGTYCTQPPPHNYKKGVTYNCGVKDCACSAYVSDHCPNARNYCWK